MIDFYELLGVKHQATKEEIKSAYHSMVKKYHPDVNKSEEANKIIISLNEAKEVLLDDEKRSEYDALLNDISHSKQFSSNKSETYSAKTKGYKENYSDVYVTKWEFFWNYLKNGLDHPLKKFLKFILVVLNFSLFMVIKGVLFCLVFLISFTSEMIDYFAGLIMIIAVLSLFGLGGDSKIDYIPFLSSQVERFLMFSVIALVIEMLKIFMIEKSYNLFAICRNIEDWFFVFILMRF